MEASTSNATCNLCHKEMTPRGMGRHLSSCLEKNGHTVVNQSAKSPGILHIKVDSGIPNDLYWLHLAVDRNTPLEELDSFLRDIWLEGCGHLSAFYSGSAFSSDEIDMSRKIGHVLAPKGFISYVYDFGSTTKLVIHALSEHAGKIKGNEKISLLARNPAPEFLCQGCEQEKAEFICHECLMEDCNALFCPACLQNHDCEDAMVVRVMNSPRCGVCAYGA